MKSVRWVKSVRGMGVHVVSVIPSLFPFLPFLLFLPSFLVHFPFSLHPPPPCLPSLPPYPPSLPLPSLSSPPPCFLGVHTRPQANVNARGGSRQGIPLHYASLKNHVAIATILLEAGANEFARDLGGYTPLNLCIGRDMCKLLHKVW